MEQCLLTGHASTPASLPQTETACKALSREPHRRNSRLPMEDMP
jgi:hypothetical protein